MNPEDKDKETVSDQDKNALQLAKMRLKIAEANAEKALAQTECAEVSYRYLLLQVYFKYKIDPKVDALDEEGNIIRNNKESAEF